MDVSLYLQDGGHKKGIRISTACDDSLDREPRVYPEGVARLGMNGDEIAKEKISFSGK